VTDRIRPPDATDRLARVLTSAGKAYDARYALRQIFDMVSPTAFLWLVLELVLCMPDHFPATVGSMIDRAFFESLKAEARP